MGCTTDDCQSLNDVRGCSEVKKFDIDVTDFSNDLLEIYINLEVEKKKFISEN